MTFATRNRVDRPYDLPGPLALATTIPIMNILPTNSEWEELKLAAVAEVEQILQKHLGFLHEATPSVNAPHQYSKELATKSAVVSAK